MTFPGLAFSEEVASKGFALQLYDGFTGQSQLQGQISVIIRGQRVPMKKTDSATFIFSNLPAGAYAISVQPSAQTPFYSQVNVPVTLPLPDPLWQAYPDLSLADQTKPLDDPTQPAAYRAQRELATLLPTPGYPFPPGATLLRGTVFAQSNPLLGATVQTIPVAAGSIGLNAISDGNGEFVLFFNDVNGLGRTVTIRATHPLRPQPVDVQVTLQRAATVTTQIVM